MEQRMTFNRIKPFLLGASLVALVFAAPSVFAGTSQPAATSISTDTAQFSAGAVALIGDDQPAPPSDQGMGKDKGKHKGKSKGKHKGKGKGKGNGKPNGDTAPKSGE